MISKNQMMEELAEYDNLIKAMAALFFTSKKMSEAIPCIFQGWKEFAFESKANKIRTLLSEDKKQRSKAGTFDSTDQASLAKTGAARPGMLETKDFS